MSKSAKKETEKVGTATKKTEKQMTLSDSVVSKGASSALGLRATPNDVLDPNGPLNKFLEERTTNVREVPSGQIAQFSDGSNKGGKPVQALIFARKPDLTVDERTIQLYNVSVERIGCDQPKKNEVNKEPEHVAAHYAARPSERTVLVKRRNSDGSTSRQAFKGLACSLIRISPSLLFCPAD
jgi:hypothetical protein